MSDLNEQGPRWYPAEQAELESRTPQTPPERGWQKDRSQNHVRTTDSEGFRRLERKVLGLGPNGESVAVGSGSGATRKEVEDYYKEREILERHYPGTTGDAL